MELIKLNQKVRDQIYNWYYLEDDVVLAESTKVFDQMKLYLISLIKDTRDIYGNGLQDLFQYFMNIENVKDQVKEARLRVAMRLNHLTSQIQADEQMKMKTIMEAVQGIVKDSGTFKIRGMPGSSPDDLLREYEVLDVKEFNDFIKPFIKRWRNKCPLFVNNKLLTL